MLFALAIAKYVFLPSPAMVNRKSSELNCNLKLVFKSTSAANFKLKSGLAFLISKVLGEIVTFQNVNSKYFGPFYVLVDVLMTSYSG